MAQRLLLVAHGVTAGVRDLVFGESGDLLPGAFPALSGRIAAWASGPERACVATVTRLGGQAEPIPELRNCDFGAWTDRALGDIAADDPHGLDAWLRDPYAVPHGGESLAELITRVGRVLDDHPWPSARSVVVVTSLVARALIVHALGAGPEVIFRIDVSPLGRVQLSRSDSVWRLQQLT
jgi:broad specificity phosphatase PhoE